MPSLDVHLLDGSSAREAIKHQCRLETTVMMTMIVMQTRFVIDIKCSAPPPL
jgi:hypothetical protein